MFSFTIADEKNTYYFNLYSGQDHLGNTPPEDVVLDNLEPLCKLFLDKSKLWFMANAKFDLRRLSMINHGIHGDIHDVIVAARILRNDHLDYSLDAIAKRHGVSKSKEVENYIKKYKLSELVSIPGKKKRDSLKHFDKVPLDIMMQYACQDARITYTIGVEQLNVLSIQE